MAMTDQVPHTQPEIPPGTRVYAIGDVHGRCDLLDQLLDAIAVDSLAAPARRVLVMLGDYIDRGDDSFGVMERLVALRDGELLDGFELHFLKGNHEDMMLSFLSGPDGDGWLNNGGREMLSSYKVALGPDLNRVRADLLAALPHRHREILRDLEHKHAEGDYGFVHAGILPETPWDAQSPDDLIWIRATFLDSDADFDHFIVHGHTPRDEVVVRPNRIGIDTRAWASGVLTCLVLEGASQRFLDTRPTQHM